METTLKFIITPGLKSVYCQGIDKYIYQDGITTNVQKEIGYLAITPNVYLVGSVEHGQMLKHQEKIEAYRKDKIKADAEAKKKAELLVKAEAENMSEADKAHREAIKPTGADKAKVDEIRQNLEKEIANKVVSKTSNKKGKR